MVNNINKKNSESSGKTEDGKLMTIDPADKFYLSSLLHGKYLSDFMYLIRKYTLFKKYVNQYYIFIS